MMAFLIGITLLTISPAYADHDRAVTTEQMPRQAQEFIARYFPGEKISRTGSTIQRKTDLYVLAKKL